MSELFPEGWTKEIARKDAEIARLGRELENVTPARSTGEIIDRLRLRIEEKDAEISRLKNENARYIPSQWRAKFEDVENEKNELYAEIAGLKEDKASLEKSILDQSHALVDEITRLRDELDKYRWHDGDDEPLRLYEDSKPVVIYDSYKKEYALNGCGYFPVIEAHYWLPLPPPPDEEE